MKTQTRRSTDLSLKPSDRRKTPKKTSRDRLEELKQQQARLLAVVKKNHEQYLYLSKNREFLAAQQLFNANAVIGQELILINKEISDLERAISG